MILAQFIYPPLLSVDRPRESGSRALIFVKRCAIWPAGPTARERPRLFE